MNIQIKLIFVMSISLFITACSGGGDESAEPQIASKVAPFAVVSNDISVDATAQVTLNGSESKDSDGTIVSYEWRQTSGSYNVELTDFNKAIASFTAPDVTSDTQLAFELTVTDNDGDTSTGSMKVDIKRVNKAPTAQVPASLEATGNNQVVLNGAASSDSDGTVVSYTWVQTSGTTVAITDSTSATASFTAPNTDTQLSFQLTVADNDGATNSNTVEVNIQAAVVQPAPNQSPIASVAAVLNTTGNATTTLNGSASSDPDGTIVSYNWVQVSGSPRVILSKTASPMTTFTAPDANTQLVFQLTVTDDAGAKSIASTTVIIQKLVIQNQAPTANAAGNLNVDENSQATLNGSASSDSDGTIVSYIWTQISGSPSVAINNSNQSIATFTAPSVDANTQLVFQLTVTDNDGATNSNNISITINSVNQAPIANASNDFSADEDTLQTLDASASNDPDGTIASHSWTQISGSPSVSITGANQAVATFTAPSVDADTQLVFQLTVTDDEGEVNVDSITVSIIDVDEANQTPVAVTDNNFSADEDTLQTLDASASNDPDGTIASFSWTQISGSPTVSITGANQTVATFTAPSVDADTQLVFQLTVTDDEGETDTDSITVTITNVEANQAPVAVTDNDFSIDENTSVTLNGSSSSDTDGTISSYSWTQTAGTPNVAINSPNSATANFMAPDVSESTVLTFQLYVTDDEGAVDTNTVTITINPVVENPPPASGVATLSWTAPTENTDDSALTDLAGFKVYYGDAADQLNDSITITTLDNFVVIEGLTNEQTYYFAVVACNDIGIESELSNISSKFIQ